MLSLFDEKYENLIADHPDAMKEMDMLRAAICSNFFQSEYQWDQVETTSRQS
jgi:hypothetical protein